MAVEEYSSFEFIKPADYVKGFDEVANKNAWDGAAQQAAVNAKVRVQNAKMFDKAINNMYQLAPTLAKLWEQKRDEEELKGRNEMTVLAEEMYALGYNRDTQQQWEKDNKDHIKDTGTYENLALEAVAQNKPDLARQLRNLHGREQVWLNEELAIRDANNFAFNMREDFNQGFSVENPNNPDEPITIDSWDDQADLEYLINHYKVQKGYSEISGLSDEFLAKHYFPAIKRQLNAFRQNIAASRSKIEEKARDSQWLEQIKLAGSDSQSADNLVEKLIEVAGHTDGRYGPSGSKTNAINMLDQLLAEGLISRQKYLQVMDVQIPNKGKQGKLERFGDVWKNHFGNWEDRIVKAEQKAYEVRRIEHDNKRNSFSTRIEEAIQQAGGDWTEDDVKFWSKAWAEDPNHVGIKPPEILATLAKDTVEDRADQDYVATMQANLDMGLPVGDSWRRIKDPELKKEWAQTASSAAGSGLTTDQKNFRDAQIGRWATEKLSGEYGVAGQTSKWGKVQTRGKEIYMKHFRKAYTLFPDDPGQRHQWALDETEKEIANSSIESLTARPDIDINAPGNKLKGALNNITTNKQNGINIITSGIIEGTEKDFEQVLKFAQNPVAYSIPSIYYQIAQNIKFKKKEDGKILTGWDIANYQHLSQTGKELPKPGWRKTMDTYSPAVQYFLQVSPSYARKEQARILHQENGDFSKPEYTLPGVTATALQELENK